MGRESTDLCRDPTPRADVPGALIPLPQAGENQVGKYIAIVRLPAHGI